QQVQGTGSAEEQATALRDAMRVLFPEAVALVSAARRAFRRESWARRRAEPGTAPDQPAAERQANASARRPDRGPVAAQSSRPLAGGLCVDLVLDHAAAPLDLKYLDLERERYHSNILTSRLFYPTIRQ